MYLVFGPSGSRLWTTDDLLIIFEYFFKPIYGIGSRNGSFVVVPEIKPMANTFVYSKFNWSSLFLKNIDHTKRVFR